MYDFGMCVSKDINSEEITVAPLYGKKLYSFFAKYLTHPQIFIVFNQKFDITALKM